MENVQYIVTLKNINVPSQSQKAKNMQALGKCQL